MAKYRDLMRSLGPGLLYAGAAIGVSHLVQSTRAGAEYGYILIIAIVLANILKYPFFEAGPRFAGVTGKSLLTGYGWIGSWAVWLFFIHPFHFYITWYLTKICVVEIHWPRY